MKNILLIVFFTFFTLNISAQNGKNEKAVIKTNIVCEHCKVCPTCGLSFKENLYKIDGLKMYELDEATMTFTVYYNGKKNQFRKN